MSTTPRIVSVNVGRPRPIPFRGHQVTTAIYKQPVDGDVRVSGVNLEGDDQADRRVHGGPDKAVYAYAAEDYEWWESELARSLLPGEFGENLTIEGIDVTGAVIGQRWHIRDVILEVSQPRLPCFRLGVRMDDPDFPDRFSAAGRPGSYLRIAREGHFRAGDTIKIGEAPAHGVTVGDVVRILEHDHDEAGRLLEVEQLPANLHHWAAAQNGRHIP